MSRCDESAGGGRAERGQAREMANARNVPDPPKMILESGSLRPESVLSRVAYELLWRVLGSGLRPPAAEVRTIDAAY
eukprot:4578746-Prymnesium_polylepis.1